MTAALAATDLVLAREQKLHAIDGLAAAAAHELGTPLSTIVLIAKELERELATDGAHTEDVALLMRVRGCSRFLLSLVRRHCALHGSIITGTQCEGADPVLR